MLPFALSIHSSRISISLSLDKAVLKGVAALLVVVPCVSEGVSDWLLQAMKNRLQKKKINLYIGSFLMLPAMLQLRYHLRFCCIHKEAALHDWLAQALSFYLLLTFGYQTSAFSKQLIVNSLQLSDSLVP